MQPEGPYRFTHLLGGSPVGKAWAAIDEQGRFVSVAVLDATVAAAPGWREAFAEVANALAQSPDGPPITYADFSAAAPWVAYAAEAGPAPEKLFRALGVEYKPVPAAPRPVSAPPQPVSGVPQPVSGVPQPVSGVPQPVSGAPQPVVDMPHAPWAVQSAAIPNQPAAHPVSAAPASSAPASPAGPAGHDVAPTPATVSGPPADVPQFDPYAAPVRRIKPSAPPKRRTGLWAGVAALALVAVVGGGAGIYALSSDEPGEPDPPPTATSTGFPAATPLAPGLKPWAQAALRSPEERALAVAGPSMVFVEVMFTGYVRNKADGALLNKAPVTFSRRCSGVVVQHEGHVLTNSQCVQPTPDVLVGSALNSVANRLVAEGSLQAKDISTYTRSRVNTSVLTGANAADQPESRLYGQLNIAKGEVTDSPAIPGTVVRALPIEAGNVALVKLEQKNLPTAELNTSASVSPETSLLVLGYGTSDTSFRAATYTVLSKTVTVTGLDTSTPLNPYRINEDLGLYSRGGIAIDPSGRVVGMLDNDVLRPDKANRLVVPVSTMTALLQAGGVTNALGKADNQYRSGLDAYFAGDESTAIARFDEAARNSPANLLAQSYRQAAVDSRGPDDSGGSSWAVPVIAAAGGALAVAIVVAVAMLLARRRNSRF
ncbi:trypsin-like peptidase domain-containing protein [Micromonospora sp. MED01]|uniref:trypsin-like peptidase domain-containing protein n=1 Tax=Micromonospora alfalfae TaxID=2911212 RepID=UPI001EE7A5CB|nr:trypsin-like peptidase domain-containing protein [Micromonospora alfalfae]MCG5460143.1 trypsin-like peptidase domain-containing protein [Micromonospora alfalfae]